MALEASFARDQRPASFLRVAEPSPRPAFSDLSSQWRPEYFRGSSSNWLQTNLHGTSRPWSITPLLQKPCLSSSDYRILLTLSSLLLHLVQARLVPLAEKVPRWLTWVVLWLVTELVVVLGVLKDDGLVTRPPRVRSHATETLLAAAMVAATTLEEAGNVRWILPLVMLLLDSRHGLTAPKPALPSFSGSKVIALLATMFSTFVLLPDAFSPSILVSGLAYGACQWWNFFSISFLNNDRGARDEYEGASLTSRLEIARSITGRGLIAYLLLCLWSGERVTLNVTTLLLAIFEALKLIVIYFLIWMVPTSVTPATMVYTATSSSIATVLTTFRASTFVAAAEFTLVYLINACGAVSKRGIILWILYIHPLWMLFSFAREMYVKHPIEHLMDQAKALHQAKVARQSKTLSQAVAEYRRRYHRSPPPGFDLWFARAQELNVTLIDEYDTITKSFEPLWGFPVDVLRKNLQAAIKDDHVYPMYLVDETFETTMAPAFRLLEEFKKQADLFEDVIPDLRVPLAMNRFHDHDLPRVMWPPDMNLSSDFEWDDLGWKSTWEVLTSSCPEILDHGIPPSSTFEPIPFLTSVSESKDVCHHPELRHLHGAWSPARHHSVTHNAVPIWSATKLSNHGDILFPSAYYAHDFRRETSGIREWHGKTNDLYWAGSTTGMSLRPDEHWSQYPSQRHHLVGYTNNIAPWDANQTLFLRRPDESSAYVPYALPSSVLADRYNISFSKIIQCAEQSCSTQAEQFHSKGVQAHWAHESHRLLMDIDGNSFSGRFYRLLEANATVFKITIFQEPHDDLLMPWLHYVPISLGMEELGETVRFFTEEGQERAWDVAREGRRFALESLRREDSAAGLVRALLEYDRVMSEDRDEMSCC